MLTLIRCHWVFKGTGVLGDGFLEGRSIIVESEVLIPRKSLPSSVRRADRTRGGVGVSGDLDGVPKGKRGSVEAGVCAVHVTGLQGSGTRRLIRVASC
jgi:hypothetical protein